MKTYTLGSEVVQFLPGFFAQAMAMDPTIPSRLGVTKQACSLWVTGKAFPSESRLDALRQVVPQSLAVVGTAAFPSFEEPMMLEEDMGRKRRNPKKIFTRTLGRVIDEHGGDWAPLSRVIAQSGLTMHSCRRVLTVLEACDLIELRSVKGAGGQELPIEIRWRRWLKKA